MGFLCRTLSLPVPDRVFDACCNSPLSSSNVNSLNSSNSGQAATASPDAMSSPASCTLICNLNRARSSATLQGSCSFGNMYKVSLANSPSANGGLSKLDVGSPTAASSSLNALSTLRSDFPSPLSGAAKTTQLSSQNSFASAHSLLEYAEEQVQGKLMLSRSSSTNATGWPYSFPGINAGQADGTSLANTSSPDPHSWSLSGSHHLSSSESCR